MQPDTNNLIATHPLFFHKRLLNCKQIKLKIKRQKGRKIFVQDINGNNREGRGGCGLIKASRQQTDSQM
jgi:hypothetical protein